MCLPNLTWAVFLQVKYIDHSTIGVLEINSTSSGPGTITKIQSWTCGMFVVSESDRHLFGQFFAISFQCFLQGSSYKRLNS